MQRDRKIEILNQLGDFFKHLVNEEREKQRSTLQSFHDRGLDLIENVNHENGWFTPDSVESTFRAWSNALEEPKLEQWLANYNFDSENYKVGVIMAGNIPLVGLHDAISVLISGHELHAKLSSKDKSLMQFSLDLIQSIAPEWKDKVKVTEKLDRIDTLIATGSDNSARYFEYYFRDKKKLLRKNRTSVAIIKGDETAKELEGLADDVFKYFGLGCRNVTKLYLPEGFDKDKLFQVFYKYKHLAEHNKYANNYDYNKAVYLLNQIELVENGFLLLKEDEGLHSPVGVLFYENYDSLNKLEYKLNEFADEIQCIVSKLNGENHIPFGKAQEPELWDYADGVDTVEFLNQ